MLVDYAKFEKNLHQNVSQAFSREMCYNRWIYTQDIKLDHIEYTQVDWIYRQIKN